MNTLHPAPVPVAAPSGHTFAFAYAIFSIVFLITMIATTAITYILPESYASTARIKVELPATVDGFSALRSEVEIIQSQVVLEKVIRALNLNVLWGKKYFNGENLKEARYCLILSMNELDVP